MLSAYPARGPQGTSLKSAAWVDLLDPTDAERAAFEQAFGLRVPTAEELVEIETTSRLRNEHGSLYMTAPLLYAADDEPWVLVPTGFVLSEKILLTVRSSKLVAFHKVVEELEKSEQIEPAPIFARLLEALVDRMADVLENSARDLDDASHLIFRPDALKQSRARARDHETAAADDPHRPYQRTHGARAIHARLPRSHRQIRRRTLPRMDPARCRQPAAHRLLRHRLARAIHRGTREPRAASAGRRERHHQHRSERGDEGSHHRLGRRHTAGVGRRHLRHEFQAHAGIRLDLGLSLRAGGRGHHRPFAAHLVQMEGLDLGRGDDLII